LKVGTKELILALTLNYMG